MLGGKYTKMMKNNRWSEEYFDKEFEESDPWSYLSSDYELNKYKRQLSIMADRIPNPLRILEIGCAEGAHTQMITQEFPNAKIMGIDISNKALQRAREKVKKDSVTFLNADIIDYLSRFDNEYFDIIIWSESIYYIGDRLSFNDTYILLQKLVNKISRGGILCMANIVDQPEGPEAPLTERPIIECYFSLLSRLMDNIHKSSHFEEKFERKLGRNMHYNYQIWIFRK
jgi:ubiquinone/menaquinone biosynthesis C-methylase UbiE